MLVWVKQLLRAARRLADLAHGASDEFLTADILDEIAVMIWIHKPLLGCCARACTCIEGERLSAGFCQVQRLARSYDRVCSIEVFLTVDLVAEREDAELKVELHSDILGADQRKILVLSSDVTWKWTGLYCVYRAAGGFPSVAARHWQLGLLHIHWSRKPFRGYTTTGPQN